jgi:nucleotide-binding universal stress UspA family protein
MAEGRVLVGVDGSEGSLGALRWAARYSLTHDRPLVPIVAWEPSALSTIPVVGVTQPADEVEAQLSAGLADTLADEDLGAPSGQDVRPVVVQAHAASALLDTAGPDDVIVVGSRGRGGFRGLVLGSTSQHVAQHAPCPVVIVPER